MIIEAPTDIFHNPITSQLENGSTDNHWHCFCHCWLSNYVLITLSVNTIQFLHCDFLTDEDEMIL